MTEIEYRDVEVSFLSLSLSHKHTSVFFSLHTDPFSPSLIFHLSMPQVIKEVEKVEYRDVEIEVIKEVEVEKIVKEIEYRDVEVCLPFTLLPSPSPSPSPSFSLSHSLSYM